jgi:hypothetical protein
MRAQAQCEVSSAYEQYLWYYRLAGGTRGARCRVCFKVLWPCCFQMQCVPNAMCSQSTLQSATRCSWCLMAAMPGVQPWHRFQACHLPPLECRRDLCMLSAGWACGLLLCVVLDGTCCGCGCSTHLYTHSTHTHGSLLRLALCRCDSWAVEHPPHHHSMRAL